MEGHSRFDHGPLKLAGVLSPKYCQQIGRTISAIEINVAYTVVVNLLGFRMMEKRREKERKNEEEKEEKRHVMDPPLTLWLVGNSVYALLPDTDCKVLS